MRGISSKKTIQGFFALLLDNRQEFFVVDAENALLTNRKILDIRVSQSEEGIPVVLTIEDTENWPVCLRFWDAERIHTKKL